MKLQNAGFVRVIQSFSNTKSKRRGREKKSKKKLMLNALRHPNGLKKNEYVCYIRDEKEEVKWICRLHLVQ